MAVSLRISTLLLMLTTLKRSFTTTSGVLLIASSSTTTFRRALQGAQNQERFCASLVPEPEGTHYSAIGCLLLLQALKLC
jgi:hypothetical protein